ncbi:hypothetical protein TrRE_jg10825 [Triparma retinervis]|jgi:hypothetical protein|uniref:Methyltransferase domain-containing protein n=1 Tax=Triparma retinervis TaxID=2557542 RepID=A0A9W7FI60_9STRA|nr:hypothetical protein TrRE_jg10825 [Triparma retinervis]
MSADELNFTKAEATFDAALARFDSLHEKTTKPRETYFLDQEEVDSETIVDSYRFPKHHDGSFITPQDVSLRTNLFSLSWMVVLNKVFDQLNLTKMDTLVHLSCGDGRWMIEAASKTGCHCIGYGVDPDLEYRCDKRAYEQEVGERVEYRLVEDIMEGDLGEATAVICHAAQEGMSALREKLSRSLDPYTPVVVVGGVMVGWLHQWETRHRGVPIYLYSRRSGAELGANDVGALREVGEYRNPNDRMFAFSEDYDEKPRNFHLEDLGSLGREESNAGDSLDRRNYQPEYSKYVHTPHPIKSKK